MLAVQLDLCEVCIFFNDRLLRGNRAVKTDVSALAAFASPNHPPLACVGATGVQAKARHTWRPPPVSRLRVYTNLESRVVVVRVAPGFDDSAIQAMCMAGAVALDTYEVGQRLLQLGVVPAGDMTTEACVTKLAYLSGRGLVGDQLRVAMSQNLRGELTESAPELRGDRTLDMRLRL